MRGTRRAMRGAPALTALFALMMLFTLALNACTSEPPEPPIAKIDAVTDTLFGDVRVDPYHWLRGRDNPEVISYLEEENEYAEAMMEPTESLQERLYEEMLGRIVENDQNVPVRRDDWLYYSRTEEGKPYQIHCRKPVGGGDEQIIFDENARAEEHEYYRVGVFSISPDHNWIAFSEDTAGRELYDLRFKNLSTGEVTDVVADSVYYTGAWGNDNATFFYTVVDPAIRPFKVKRHTLGSGGEDVTVAHEPDERYFMRIGKTRDDAFVLVNYESKLTSEVQYVDADNPTGTFRTVIGRRDGVEYSVTHHGDRFYVLTNDGAINFRLMSVSDRNPRRRGWREVIGGRSEVLIHGVEMFRDFMVVTERENATRYLHVHPMNGGASHRIEFPEKIYAAFLGANPNFGADSLRIQYSSFVTPRTTYSYDVKSRTLVTLKRDEVKGGFNPDDYVTERLMAPARDGELVPVSLFYRKGTPLDGSAPLLLYGYGSYGSTMDPWFSSTKLSLVDRGIVYAVAHIRGSQAKGRTWYEEGKFLQKKNTFRDFIDVGEFLVAEGYTSKDRMAAMGGSAGGLLMGAVINMRPDLFHSVIAAVPFVDVVNTMLDPTIPLTVTEYEEWGNPNDEEYYHYMKSYAPYENVTAQQYPHLLVTAGLNDPRVQYWEPAKWVAKLRASKTGDNLLLFKTNMGAGHGGSSGRYGWLEETAFEYAFLLFSLGLEQ